MCMRLTVSKWGCNLSLLRHPQGESKTWPWFTSYQECQFPLATVRRMKFLSSRHASQHKSSLHFTTHMPTGNNQLCAHVLCTMVHRWINIIMVPTQIIQWCFAIAIYDKNWTTIVVMESTNGLMAIGRMDITGRPTPISVSLYVQGSKDNLKPWGLPQSSSDVWTLQEEYWQSMIDSNRDRRAPTTATCMSKGAWDVQYY